jgi:hypothetical protein
MGVKVGMWGCNLCWAVGKGDVALRPCWLCRQLSWRGVDGVLLLHYSQRNGKSMPIVVGAVLLITLSQRQSEYLFVSNEGQLVESVFALDSGYNHSLGYTVDTLKTDAVADQV